MIVVKSWPFFDDYPVQTDSLLKQRHLVSDDHDVDRQAMELVEETVDDHQFQRGEIVLI
jgi:hypothetical protein